MKNNDVIIAKLRQMAAVQTADSYLAGPVLEEAAAALERASNCIELAAILAEGILVYRSKSYTLIQVWENSNGSRVNEAIAQAVQRTRFAEKPETADK